MNAEARLSDEDEQGKAKGKETERTHTHIHRMNKQANGAHSLLNALLHIMSKGHGAQTTTATNYISTEKHNHFEWRPSAQTTVKKKTQAVKSLPKISVSKTLPRSTFVWWLFFSPPTVSNLLCWNDNWLSNETNGTRAIQLIWWELFASLCILIVGNWFINFFALVLFCFDENNIFFNCHSIQFQRLQLNSLLN